MTNNELYETACALYDGGWKPEDREQLIAEYGFTQDEADVICGLLGKFEGNARKLRQFEF